MRQQNHRIPAASFLAVLVFSVACGDKQSEPPREIALTPPPTNVEQPLRDVPPAKAPPTKAPPKPTPAVVPTPAPPPVVTPPAAPPVARPPVYSSIPAGTELAVRPAEKVCTNTHKVGDHVVASVAEVVAGPEGANIPAGSAATLEVVESQFGNNDAKKVKLVLRVASVTVGSDAYDITGAGIIAPPITNVRRQSTGDQAKKVAIGTAAGAVVGRVLGGNKKGTVVGGVIGAGAGAVTAANTADYDGCIAADVRLVAKLGLPLRVRVGADRP